MSQWSHILSASELDSFHALTASLDPAFADSERAFYLSRTKAQLGSLAAGAWYANEPTGYQLARSYLAMQL